MCVLLEKNKIGIMQCSTCKGQKRATDPVALELQAVGSWLAWVLRIKHGPHD